QILKQDAAPFECDVSSILNEEEKKKYENGREKYLKIVDDSSKLSLTQIISEIWYEFGYQYETMWNKNVEMFAKMYDILFEAARLAEEKNTSLAAFSDYLKTQRADANQNSSSKFETSIPLEQSEGVHIMSIHKSKGLEFPVVFVANTEKKQNNQESRQRVQFTKKYGLSFKGFSDYFYKRSKDENEALECAELKRLTYVALTRAENTVFITTGNYSKSKDSEKQKASKKLPTSIFKVLEPSFNYFGGDSDMKIQGLRYFDEEKIPTYKRSEISGDGRKNTMAEKEVLKKKLSESEGLKNAKIIRKEEIPERYIKPSHLYGEDSKNQVSKEAIEAESASANEKNTPYYEIKQIVESTRPKASDENKKPEPRFNYSDFGTIAHAFMEGVVNKEKPVILQKNIAEISGTEKLERVLAICTEMADTFKESELGKEAMNSQWHRCEYDFIWRLPDEDGNDKIMNGSIDLVFKNKDSNYTIVDYKTDSKMNPEEHYVQLNCYRKVFSELIGCEEKDINCVLYYLRYGKAVDITDKLGFEISLKP
nr:ATP-binding domain-containing protein [Treponemataceae bacterium]